MVDIKLSIKKELTEDEFKSLIVVCEVEFERVNEISKIALGCELKAKDITPASEAFVLLAKPNDKEFEVVTLDKTIHIDVNKESILSECCKTKQPLLVNDATRSFLYSEKIDNFLNIELKDLLLVPIVDDSSQKNVLAIMWMAIETGNLNQYTQKDLDYMSRFSIFIKRFLQNKKLVMCDHSDDASFTDCMEAYDKLTSKIRREQEYFSSIIHDVRTPMNAVMGFLELLNLREEDRDKKEYIETAIKSGKTMVALINDALDISKIASGKMSVEKIEFSALDELSDVAKLFYNTAKRQGVTLVAYYDSSFPKLIYSDYHRIKQIMNNLLSNAIKFTPKGGKIALELIYDKKRDGLTVSVKDSGIGIADDMQKKIFTPYTQEKNSTSREYGGTGLGLSIAQQLSVLLGGKLELESKEGKGSRFFFTIPCHTKRVTPPDLDKQKLKELSVMFYSPKNGDVAIHTTKRYLKEFDIDLKETKSDQPLESVLKDEFDILVISRDDTVSYQKEMQKVLETGKSVIIVGDGYLSEGYYWFIGNVRRINAPILPHELYDTIIELTTTEDEKIKEKVFAEDIKKIEGKEILVVDDNTINLKFMREVLKTMRLDSTLAQSGEESIEKLNNKSFDMIFMDENMPGIQGSEAIRLIRKREKEKKLSAAVIISITGDADKNIKIKLLDIGANDVLTKPVHIEDIKQTILKYL